MNETRRISFVRLSLLVLALPQLAIAVWALTAPRGWFETFPGGGKAWLPLYGPYDEHLVRDVGSTFLGLGALLLVAAVWMNRRVVQAALVAYLAYQLPHAIYHFGADYRLSAGDQIVNGTTLALAVVLAAAALAYSGARRSRPAAPPQASEANGTGRLRSRPGGLLARGAHWCGRRRFGRAPATIDAYLHHPRLLMGYGTFETAVEGSDRVDERLKSLAELRAASVVGCEWCMDFGSWLSRGHGVPERQLRELPRYRESDAFSDLERLVLDYASAMTRTPAEVDDDLFARLREHFDDAQLVELTNVIAVENLRARFNDALALDPQGFSQGGFCVIPGARAGVHVRAGMMAMTRPTRHEPTDNCAARVPRLITTIGVLHLAVSPAAQSGLAPILRAGVVDAVGDNFERESAAWYALTGLGFLALGDLARFTVQETDRVPARLGAWVTLLGVATTALMPVSGGWALIGVGCYALRAAQRTSR